MPRRTPSSKSRPPEPADHAHDDGQDERFVRLQKALASAGYGSRRKCEELILTGRVEVDHQLVTELGTKVDPHKSHIRVDGQTVKIAKHVYYAVNKPTNVVSTNFDPSGRTRVIDLLPESAGRLFTVGRLDKSSEGLILVTNDGELANQLAHPRYGVEKTYVVLVAGTPDPKVYDQLRDGVRLSEGLARVVSVKVRSQPKHSTILEIVLNEGKNREIRRILAALGHKVMRLKRTAFGSLRLGDLPPGEHRRLRPHEVAELERAVKQGKRRGKPRRKAFAKSRSGAESSSARVRRGERGETSQGPRQRPAGQTARKGAGDKARRAPRRGFRSTARGKS